MSLLIQLPERRIDNWDQYKGLWGGIVIAKCEQTGNRLLSNVKGEMYSVWEECHCAFENCNLHLVLGIHLISSNISLTFILWLFYGIDIFLTTLNLFLNTFRTCKPLSKNSNVWNSLIKKINTFITYNSETLLYPTL